MDEPITLQYRVNGFNWLSNGKDSCWIRMQS